MSVKYSEVELDAILVSLVPHLRLHPSLDPFCVLKSLATQESSYGKNCKPRFEPYYAPGGLYFTRSPELQAAYEKHGAGVSFSYGPFQILYATAMRFGYEKDATPESLERADLSGLYVCRLLNYLVIKKKDVTLDALADSYNSGNSKDRRSESVQQYVANILYDYNRLIKNKPKKGIENV